MNTCSICKKNYNKNRSKGDRGSICGSCMVTRARRRNKLKAIEYKGGKCEKCGYNKSSAALAFHHLDPSKKEFGISAYGANRNWEAVKKELDKCMLLCHNCHSELHETEHSQVA